MWREGNFPMDPWGSSSFPISYHGATHRNIHVLVVDHEKEGLRHTSNMLKLCGYQVTQVEYPSSALAMLLSGYPKFDVVIANIQSPDLHSSTLMQHAVTIGIPIALMMADYNPVVVMEALERGAFLCMRKPATIGRMNSLWQHVVREKKRIMRDRDVLMAAKHTASAMDLRFGEIPNSDDGSKDKGKNKFRGTGGPRIVDHDGGTDLRYRNQQSSINVKKKMCTDWTEELHAKFIAAVEELGEGRCFPKEILEKMNVPGLTRLEVASHLQKCRNDSWRSPEERRNQQLNSASAMQSSSGNHQPRPRRFGLKSHPSVLSQSLSTPSNNERNMEPHPSVVDSGVGSLSRPEDFFNMSDMDSLVHNLSSPERKNSTMATMAPLSRLPSAFSNYNTMSAEVKRHGSPNPSPSPSPFQNENQ